MTRHQEIREILRKLYAESAKATNEARIREIETQISRLETEAATIMTEAGQ